LLKIRITRLTGIAREERAVALPTRNAKFLWTIISRWSPWLYTTVFDVTRPLEQLRTVMPETSVSEALIIIGRDDINQLPALANGRLEGMISLDQILRYLLIRAELKM
jgi:CBS domain